MEGDRPARQAEDVRACSRIEHRATGEAAGSHRRAKAPATVTPGQIVHPVNSGAPTRALLLVERFLLPEGRRAGVYSGLQSGRGPEAMIG